MNRRGFKLTLPENIVRKMSREEYKRVHSYLRKAARAIDETIDWDGLSKKIGEAMLYGYGVIYPEDYLNEQT